MQQKAENIQKNNRLIEKTPLELGYRMPAEWEKHSGTWLSWPKNKYFFYGKILDQVEETYLEIIKVLQENEKVFLLVNDEKTEEGIRKRLSSSKNVTFYHIKTFDVWTRDYAPIFIKDKQGNVAAVKWIFNSWGNKYREALADNKAGEEIVKASGVNIFHPNIILEGGSIDTNGRDIFLTTEQCLLNKNRNPSLNRARIEEYLKNYLGAESVIWLKKGIAGDDTDGHVDDIARFVNENTVVCAYEENKGDENYAVLEENWQLLHDSGLSIIKLPMPGKIMGKNSRLPATYANFYIANKVVLLPVFNDKNDKTAINILQSLFLDREIIPIYCTALVHGHGTVHCVTQQMPA